MNKILMFPGQGSQKKGMGADLWTEFPAQTEAAEKILGYSVKDLCLEDTRDELNLTQFTQPALYVVNALSFQNWQKTEDPSTVAAFIGHSLGEYNALMAAGVFDFETGLKLVHERGRLMSQAKGGGMVAVIGLSPDQIQAALDGAGIDSIDVANFNSPEQTVVSGPKEMMEQVAEALKAAGAKRALPLPVSAAFHSRYMKPASEEFRGFLDQYDFSAPKTEVIANATATAYPSDPDSIKDTLASQIAAPVRWTDTVKGLLANHPDSEWLEVGPGAVLAGLLKRIRAAV